MLLIYCLLFFFVFTRAILSTNSQASQWTWSCVNEKCLRRTSPDDRNGVTLNVCNLLCGKYGSLWPKPTGLTKLGNHLFFFHPDKIVFDLTAVEDESPVKQYLQKVCDIFQSKLLDMCGPNCTPVPETKVKINFNVAQFDLKLDWKTDESYALNVSKTENTADIISNITTVTIDIKSNTVFGSRHALETVLQLTTPKEPPESGGSKEQNLVMISSVEIIDSPVYPHRGLLLDTSRHFIPVSAIYRTLDAMAMAKLNVLHWHATDSQSFPLEIQRVPQMLRYGAYSADKTYTVNDTKSIIEYAKLRGIRVIIEIDGPSHAGYGWQWGEAFGLGKLSLCINKEPWRKYCYEPPCGQLNPVNPNVFVILKKIFAEIVEILPAGEPIHMGGDEVFISCWNSSLEVVEWMEKNNYNNTEYDFMELWGIYQEKALQAFLESNPKTDTPVILWTSSLTNPNVIEKYLDKTRYVLQAWMEASNNITYQLLEKGYKLIMSTKDKWYLDHGFWGKTVFAKWEVMYNYKLPDHQNVLGGEAAMWSERVDVHSLDSKVWPRTAAVGERLWSNPLSNAKEAKNRYDNFRERLVASGIKADVSSTYYCYQNEAKCT